MKNFFCSLCCILLTQVATKAQMKVGDNTTTINNASLLELEATNKGLVFPRMALTSLSSPSPLPAGLLTGTVIFNTAAGVGSGVGLYYWNGSAWVAVSGSGASSGWALTGNTGTNPTNNFIGTVDGQALVFKTNNTERMRVLSTGNIGIGTTTPTNALSVRATNPLYLLGVQPTTTFTTDSILTIFNGTVKKAAYSSLPGGSGTGWLITGNNNTDDATNFIGTTNQESLVFKVNNVQAGFLGLSASSSATSFGVGSSAVFQSTAIGAGAQATGSNSSLAIGYQAIANTQNTIAIGTNDTASADEGIAIGLKARTNAFRGIAIGSHAKVSGSTQNIAVGYNSNASSFNGIAIGSNAIATTNNNTLALGVDAVSTGFISLAIGNAAQATGQNTTAFGAGARASVLNANAFGNAAIASGISSLVLGNAATASGASAIAIGDNSQARLLNSIAIGNGADANGSSSIILGDNSSTTGSSTIIIGAGITTA